MDSTERQVIDELFGKIRQAAGQSGPRDPEAEARIRQHVAQQPASPYYMAQAIIIQEQALAAANARIEQLERQLSDRPAGGFLGGLFGAGGEPAATGPTLARRWLGSAPGGLYQSPAWAGRRLSRGRHANSDGGSRRRAARQRARQHVRAGRGGCR